MYNDFNRGYNDQEARQVFNDECRNAEKCSVCGQERYGHHEEHAFKAKWEDIEFDKFGNRIKKINEDDPKEDR